MSTATIATQSATAPFWARRRWTEEEFDRLVELGMIREGSRTFLWAGEIIEPMAEDQPHINALYRLLMLLALRLPEADWTVNLNQPIRLEPGYRPQPDLAVSRGPRKAYTGRGRRPNPGDAALLAEISDSSYPIDSGELLRSYARAGVPQYWIVNIRARRVEVYMDADPTDQTYRSRKDHGLDGRVPLSLIVDGVASEFQAVAVLDVLRDSLEPARDGLIPS